jgi:hypothetical protein
MPKKKVVDADKLIKAVESGRNSKEIMAEFKIKTLPQLKSLYVDALMSRGQVATIKSSRGRKPSKQEKSKEIRVNNRGSLVVSKDLIEDMGFNIGDSFSVTLTPAGVSLKRQK